MTVAAVIVAVGGDALVEAVGRPAVRRIVDAAWAGGAMPIVVVADDPDGEVARSLGGSPARLVVGTGDVVARARAGVEAALEAVGETDGLLAWPVTMPWVDPETVTSLIEAYGRRGESPLRPRYRGSAGWPVLLPVGAVDTILGPDGEASSLEDAIAGLASIAEIDLGDPGTTHPIEVPLDDLPPFEGPPEPVGGPPPEWGAAAAETPD